MLCDNHVDVLLIREEKKVIIKSTYVALAT